MRSQCIAESNRYRGRDRVSQLLKIGEDLPRRNPEEPGQRVQNQSARLVEDKEIDVVHRQLVAIEQFLHLPWYFCRCECQNAEAVHINVLLAAPVAIVILMLYSRVCRYGHAVTSSGNDELVIPSAIGGTHHVYDVSGSGGIPEPGDGSSVTWLSDAPGPGHVVDVVCATDGTGYDKFVIPAGGDRMPISADTAVEHEDDNGNRRSQQDIHMDGLAILTFATAKVPPQVKGLLNRNQLTVSDIDLFVFHQASALVLDSLARLLRIPPGKVFTNLEQLGNTVSASIPIALSDALAANLIKSGSRVLISGFGVGLSWASALLQF